jgi:peptide deformylase
MDGAATERESRAVGALGPGGAANLQAQLRFYHVVMPYVRPILTDDHPTLRKVAKKVDLDEIRDPLFQQLVDDMFATMYAAPGIGLAAPQIDVGKRIFVIDLQDEDENHGPFVFINPRFTISEGEIESVEGCLSVPGFIGDLTRYERVVCAGLDRHGRKISAEGSGDLFSRCLQHEMDHLDGILYVDKAKNIRPAVTEEELEAAEAVEI